MHDPIHTITLMYTCMSTNTRAYLVHSSTQRTNVSTSTHSCKQAMYYTHSSVWSVELWASAAAMCCAPSAPVEFLARLCEHVCAKSDTAHVRSSRCAIPYAQPGASSYTLMHTCMSTYQIQTRVHSLHVYLASLQCTPQ
jgi:hypothetical protein